MQNTFSKKVVYLLDYPMGARDAKRYGLAELQAAGLLVEVWDISHFFYPSVHELGIECPSWVNSTVVSSIGHFRDLCSTVTIEDTVILIGGTEPGQVWGARKILRLISATPAWLTSVCVGEVPSPILSDNAQWLLGVRAKKMFSLLTQPRKWKRVPGRVAYSMYLSALAVQRRMHTQADIRPLDHIWSGMTISGIAPVLVAPSTTVTYIHTLDYDLVLALRASGGQLAHRLVFIDSMGPLHPDCFLHEIKGLISVEAYSEIVCRALDEIEKRFDSEVVIAVHPRATLGVMDKLYGGRTLIYGQITELIAGSTVVIVAEGSSAIGLAALFRRPLALLSSGKFDSYVQGMNRAYAQALDTPLIDLDAPDLPTLTFVVKEEAYAQYVQRYIKRPGTPDKPFWSVVASEIISGEKLSRDKKG